MEEEQEPLILFFGQMLQTAKDAGYKLVITLLARHADAENVFADVGRYWSSLDDLTGGNILFVLGAAGARKRLSKHGGFVGTSAGRMVAHYSPDVAVIGDRSLRWPDGEAARLSGPVHNRFGGIPFEMLVESHSGEITELRDYFRITERLIPALLIMPLERLEEASTPFVVSLSSIGSRTIYRYLKDLVGELEGAFLNLSRAQADLARLRGQADEIRKWLSRVRSKPLLWDSVRSPVDLRSLHGSRQSAEEILATCAARTRSSADMDRCYKLLREIRLEVGNHSEIVRNLQRLIDHSFFPYSANVRHWRRQESAVEADAQRLRLLLEKEWKALRTQLERSLSHLQATISPTWDFFLAYSSKDSGRADQLYRALSTYGSVFQDRVCLRRGDLWTQRLRVEQDRSKSTVVLITSHTDSAWFSTSEYLHAIDLARTVNHRVIPILIGPDAHLPYGLEQVHAIRRDDDGDFTRVAAQVARALT